VGPPPIAGSSRPTPVRGLASLVLGVVLAGCVGRPVSPSPVPATPSPGSSAGSTVQPAPTSVPTLPALELDRVATTELDGIRITIELERNPMPAGEPTWVTKTIENIGKEPIQYFPCGEAMSVRGRIDGMPWRSGQAWPNPAGTWKAYLVDHLRVFEDGRRIVFLPAGLTGSSSGCGDIAYVEILPPDGRLRERARWDGLTFRRLAPPSTTRIDLVASFAYARAGRADVEAPRLEISVHLETWIEGRSDAYLDPGEVADVALRDPRLTALLGARELSNGNEGVLIFDPGSATYQVGMLESGNLPVAHAHFLTINGVTGEIQGFVERDWDYQVDDST